MKIIIIDTYYSSFLKSFWSEHHNLQKAKYHDQLSTLLSACFGTSDYYSYNLSKLGHDVYDIIANDEVSQRTWAKEHNISISNIHWLDRLRNLSIFHRFLGHPTWIQDIVLAQISYFSPNVVYVQDLSILTPDTLNKIKKKALLVGQIACPIPPVVNLKQFDLILTSFPHYVTKFRKMNINSEYFRIGFEPRVLKQIGKQNRIYDVTFIGSFSPYHYKGIRILESLASKIPVHVWGQGLEYLSPTSPLRKNYHGEAWGLDMYKILARSKIVINRHINSSGKYANNMRLYESTGMGAMLITDYKDNINDLFEVNKELVAYVDSNDLLKKVKYYLNHPEKLIAIAEAGQNRTLKEHTYIQRMLELISILKRHL